MALFLDANTYGFLSSPDLKTWTRLHEISVPGVAECPDFFEIAVENEPGVKKWVWTGADGNYLVGAFDGARFTPEVMTQPLAAGTNNYAVQTFSDLPGGRRVQLAWMRGGRYPDMPFNHQMSCPYGLRLRRYGYNSYRLTALPVREIEALRGAPQHWANLELKPGENPLAGLSGDLWDIQAIIEAPPVVELGLRMHGHAVALGKRVRQLRVLVDRTSVEAFVNDGEKVMPACYLPVEGAPALELTVQGGVAKIVSLDVFPLRPAWG
jgi:sucrose-6-phosphate hydrolase SacC (GH32 family)